MRYLYITLSALIIFVGCCKPEVYNLKQYSNINKKNGIYYLNESKLTGQLSDYYDNGIQKYLINIKKGVRHGYSKKWFSNQKIKSVKNYSNGHAIGIHRGYWDNGEKRYLYRYKYGVQHGTQIEWYDNGVIARINTMDNGHLDGIQKGWREDGDLKFNYIYIDGKRYGFLGSELCIPPN